MFLDQIKLPYKQGRVEWDGRGDEMLTKVEIKYVQMY